MARRKKKSNQGIKILAWTLGIVVVLAGCVAVGGYLWVQSYLKSPAFRQLLAARLGQSTKSNADIDTMSWSGSTIYLPKVELTPVAPTGWKGITADTLHATVDFSTAWHQGVWTVPNVDMGWLRLQLAAPQPPKPAGSASHATEEDVAAEETTTSSVPSWLRGWLPQRTEVNGVRVEAFEMAPAPGVPGVEINSLKVKGNPATGDNAWMLRGESGNLKLPGFTEGFKLSSVSASLDAKKLTINDSVLRWLGDSEVTSRGELSFDKARGWSFSGTVNNLELRYVISQSWQGRVIGVLNADYDVMGRPAEPVLFKSKVKISSGVLQNLPVLDRIADFTRTDRFRRLVLDEATGHVEHQGDVTKITNLVLQSNALVRVEGDLLIQGQALNGNFFVGVFPEALRWVPGAQGLVFTEQRPNGPPGFLWTHLHITGTVGDPKEDLSNRLLFAAGKAILLDAPMSILNNGVDAVTNGDARSNTLETGRDLIQGAGETMKSGVDVIKGILK